MPPTATTPYRRTYLTGAPGSSGARAFQNQQIEDAQNYADRGIGDYLGAAENFDASKALNNYAQGAWGSISTALKQQLQDLSGQATGAGRFDSGFYDEDQGVLVNRALGQFSNDIAQQSMNALDAQQRNTAGLGQFGENQASDARDLVASRYETDENAAREDAERKRRKKAGVWGTIGGALGAGVGALSGGGLAGAQAGWGMGSSIGSALGG